VIQLTMRARAPQPRRWYRSRRRRLFHLGFYEETLVPEEHRAIRGRPRSCCDRGHSCHQWQRQRGTGSGTIRPPPRAWPL